MYQFDTISPGVITGAPNELSLEDRIKNLVNLRTTLFQPQTETLNLPTHEAFDFQPIPSSRFHFRSSTIMTHKITDFTLFWPSLDINKIIAGINLNQNICKPITVTGCELMVMRFKVALANTNLQLKEEDISAIFLRWTTVNNKIRFLNFVCFVEETDSLKKYVKFLKLEGITT